MLHSSRRVLVLLAGLALGLALLIPAAVAAFDLPPAQPGRTVYDLAGLWSAGTVTATQNTVAAVRARTGAEIAVVSIPTGLSSVSADQARTDAAAIMDAWGVGRAGTDDGLVVLFDMDSSLAHGQIFLYTGAGFRRLYLSDADASAIASNMIAQAKAGSFDAALTVGLAQIDAAVVPGGNPHLDQSGNAVISSELALLGGALPALALLGFFAWSWRKHGRDPRVPLIDDSVLLPAPPPGLTPAMAAALRADGVNQAVFATALVDLAHRGVLTFVEKKGFIRSSLDLQVSGPSRPPGQSDPSVGLAAFAPSSAEYQLGTAIVEAAALEGGSLTAEALRLGTGASLYSHFRNRLGVVAAASPWFANDPTKTTNHWRAAGIGVVLVSIFLALPAGLYGLTPFFAPLALAGVLVSLGASLMVSRTPEGAQVLAMALAYRNTLAHEIGTAGDISVATLLVQHKLPWLASPDDLTVWAIALGLSDEVSALIARSFERPGGSSWQPGWYQATSFVAFGSMVGAINSMATSSFSTAHSGGGGGFSGGGSFGGGGGGGSF